MLLDKRARFDVGHHAFWAQHSRQSLQRWHVLRCRNDLVKWNNAFTHFLEQLVIANVVSSFFLDLLVEFLSCEDAHFDFFASASRQDTCATHVLVALGRVDVQLHDYFECLSELSLLGDLSSGLEDLSYLVLLIRVREQIVKVARHATFQRFHLAGLFGVERLQNYEQQHIKS